MSGHYPINGIPVSPGQSIPLRREFNNWAQDHQHNIQVSLFIRALREFYQIPYTETKSYFQVAGIHGYPSNLKWDDTPPDAKDSSHGNYVYCVHGLEIFPTWHRVYMLLFEQRIHELMLEVIDKKLHFNTADEKQQWTAQANLWRLPYWNWALPKAGVGIPELFKVEKVKILAPLTATGSAEKPDEVDNPLYRYELQVDKKATKMGDLPKPFTVDDVTLGSGIKLPWSKCSGTSRWGIKNESEDKWSAGRNEWQMTNKAIQAHQYENPPEKEINKHAVSDIVYRILAPGSLSTYKDFATTDGRPEQVNNWTCFLSLEYIHDSLHSFIGGEDLVSGVGHMEDIAVAAFDPVFWFHQANVDLYLAVWQALNSHAWFDKGSDELRPFYRRTTTGEEKLYTSNDVRTWTNLGYQYDVMERKTEEDDTAYKKRIKEYVDSYPHTGQLLLSFSQQESQKLDLAIAEDLYPDYLINIFYDRHALQGDPYTIHFFLGKVSDLEIISRTEFIAKDPKYVGRVFTFTARMNDATNQRCGNCAQQAENGALSTAQIPITIPLLKQAIDPDIHGITDIKPDSVERYLIANLGWIATDAVGQIVPPNELPKTKIFTLKGKAKHYSQPEIMSEYMDYAPMSHVTDGKPLGASHGDYSSPSYGYT